MANCNDYISADDLKTGKQAILHIEHVAKSRDANGNHALGVTNTIRGQSVTNKTLDGLEHRYNQAISQVGYITTDSFEDGATLTLPNQVLRYEATGEYYRWDGEFPKTIPSGSTPETSGSIGLGAWVSVGDASLRGDLENESIGSRIVATPYGGNLAQALDAITPDMFGAIGDGLTDDTAAIQSSIDYAAANKMRVYGTGKVYAVASALQLKVGIRELAYLHIKPLTSGMTVITNANNSGDLSCDVHDNYLEMNGVGLIGMLFYGMVNSSIYNNKLDGLTLQDCYGIRVGIITGTLVSRNVNIFNNTVLLGSDPDSGTGTRTMTGIALIGQPSGQYGGLEVSGAPIWPTVNTLQNLSVRNNYVTGGTHNLVVQAVLRCDVSGNYFESASHRNINITPNSQRITVNNNRLIEAGSSAVNINAANRWITVSNNFIQSTSSSTVSSDDAAIQANSYAEGVVINGNIILGDWKYCVRMSEAIRCSITDNNFNQGGSVANIYIETDWLASADIPADAPYTRAHTRTYSCVNNTQFINISGNNHAGRSAAVALAQFGTKQLIGVSVNGEMVSGASSRTHVFHLCNQNSASSYLSLANINAGGATADKYYSSLGRLPFANINNVVGWSNTATDVSTATPYISGSNRYTLTSTTIPVTNFLGGSEGVEIVVRAGAVGTTLVRNQNLIRLKGSANWVSASTNEMVTLYNVGGIWFEKSRNF